LADENFATLPVIMREAGSPVKKVRGPDWGWQRAGRFAIMPKIYAALAQ
jgi:hypothetical protein